MTIDHDAIAARVRQNQEAGTPGPWALSASGYNVMRGKTAATVAVAQPSDFSLSDARRISALPDLEAAYLALYDEVAKLRADLHRVIDERDATFALMLARTEKAEAERDDWMRACNLAVQERMAAEAERDALRAHPYLPTEEIAAIERGNRRWHGEYDTTVSVRWEPYKPDGQRQMKAKGRWQTMTYNGSGYFRWENCDRPAQVRQALKGQTND